MNAHLNYLMADSELYGWEKVQAYYTTWLNQLEHGRMSWDDLETNLGFHCAIIWHCYHFYCSSINLSSTSLEEAEQTGLQLQCSSQAGTKACQAFNQGRCTDGSAHPR